MEFIDNDPKLIPFLKDHKTLIPFVGAGFSANIESEGSPLWDDFIRILQDDLNKNTTKADRVDFKKMFINDPAECTQYFYWRKGINGKRSIASNLAYGKKKFYKLVTKLFEKLPGYDRDKFNQHITLVNRFSKIYTTNWDSLLEIACDNSINKRGYTRVIAPINNIQYGGQFKETRYDNDQNHENKCEIVKYHGCQTDETATSLIASTADYYERISLVNVHPLDKQIAFDMKNNDFIFLGYSLRDINVRYILNQINFNKWSDIKNDKTTHFYFITFDDPAKTTPTKSKYLEDCNYIKSRTLCKKNGELLKLKSEYEDMEKKLSEITKKHTREWNTMQSKRLQNLILQKQLMKEKINIFLKDIS
jgi:hypothetical protein